MEVYDPATDTWKKRADKPTEITHFASSVVNGEIYVIGGSGHFPNFTNKVEIYNVETDTWREARNMPTVRVFHSATAVDGKIYVIGGWLNANVTPISTVEEFDPEAGPPQSVNPAGKLSATWGEVKSGD